MKVLKLFLVVLLSLIMSSLSVFAGEIDIDKADRIYNIVLKGEKVKKKDKICSFRRFDY